MIRVLHAEHAFSDRFISHMLTRNIRIEEDLIDQLLTPVRNGWPALFCCSPVWQGTPTAKDASQSISGDAGGNDWHNAHTGQFFHEQIQETRLHSLQWWTSGSQFPPKCCPARVTTNFRAEQSHARPISNGFLLTANSEGFHINGEGAVVEASPASPRSYSENLPHGPYPPLWPKRSAYGVAGRRFGSGP